MADTVLSAGEGTAARRAAARALGLCPSDVRATEQEGAADALWRRRHD